jgi:hypothetical protein
MLNCIEAPLRHAVGVLMLEWDKQGSMFLMPKGESEDDEKAERQRKAPFTVNFVRKKDSDKEMLEPEHVCEDLDFHCSQLVLVPRPYLDLPDEWDDPQLRSSVLCFDTTMAIDLRLSDELALQAAPQRPRPPPAPASCYDPGAPPPCYAILCCASPRGAGEEAHPRL